MAGSVAARVSMSAQAIDQRLREASRLAGPLSPENRLAAKIDLSGAGVARRLREASDLLELCRRLAVKTPPVSR
jgi:hypothetical protein